MLRRLLGTVSVKTKLAFACTALFVAMVAAITVGQIVQLRTSIKDVLTAQQFSLVKTVAEDIEEKFSLRQTALVSVAAALPAAGLDNPAEMQTRLAQMPALSVMFDFLVVFSPAGDVVATLPYSRDLSRANAADRDYMRTTLRTRRPVISAPYLAKVVNTPQVMLTAPVLGPDGEILAVLGGALSLLKPNFLGQIGAARLGKTGYFSVMTKGEAPLMVVHPVKSRIMTPPADGKNSIVGRALAGFEGSEEAVNSRGVHGLYSFKALREPDWLVSAMLPVEEAYAPIMAAQKHAILTGLAAALVLAPLIWLLAWRLLSPLTGLRDRIEVLRADPDSDVSLPADTRDEIGDLARDFNDLMRERRHVEEALRQTETRLLTFADNLPVLVSYIDRDQRFRYTNATHQDWFGIDCDAFLGRTMREVFGDREYAKVEANVATVLSGYPVTHEREANYGGMPRFVQATYLPHYGPHGEVPGFYVLVNDISARKALEVQLAHRAQHDALTGLPNRALFEDRLAQAMIRRARTGEAMALMYLDVDHFKRVNDTYGHASGDALLKTFAARLADCVRASDTVARLGGDEFTVLLEGLACPDFACEVADKILAAMHSPLRLGDAIVTVSTSIGIAWAADGEIAPADLLNRADAALYCAKAKGKNNYQFAIDGDPLSASAA